MKDKFLQRKKAVLSKLDKSAIGSWDRRVVKLCERINKSRDYYTTSSCAGRIVLIFDRAERSNLFVKVWHDKISLKELVASLCSVSDKKLLTKKCGDSDFSAKKSDKVDFESQPMARQRVDLKFKQEPPILHVACRNLESAQEILKKARAVGWKRSGIISFDKNKFVAELLSTEKMEFPIISGGKVLVDENFLGLVVKKANENLVRGWRKIDGLMKKIK